MAAKKKATTKGTELITMDMFTVDNVPMLLAKVNDSLKAIKGVGDEDETTAGKALPGFGYLKDINDTSTLIQAYSAVSNREKAYSEAAKEMGITKVPPFKLEGVSADTWLKAIIRRERVASSAARIEKLEKMKTILMNRMSEEDKMKAEFQEFKDILGDM